MNKQEFIGKVKDMLAMNAVYPEIKADLDSVITEAIAEHEAAQWKKYVDLLSEIEAWLCFNTTPSSEDTANVRKSINDLLGKK